jgi:uncharacterized protein YjbJ (UPF0337 family)
MSLFERAKAKAGELLGRAEEVYGQTHGDAAATLDGEARRLEGEAEEEQEDREHDLRHGRDRDRRRPGDDDDGVPAVL